MKAPDDPAHRGRRQRSIGPRTAIVGAACLGLVSSALAWAAAGPAGRDVPPRPAAIPSSADPPVQAQRSVQLAIPTGQLPSGGPPTPAGSGGAGWWVSPLEGSRPSVRRAFQPPAQPWLPGHRGVDLPGWVGASVRAVADGVVVFAGPVGGVPVVSVAHPDGIRSTYQPVLPRVRTGQVVRRGQLIGILTDTAAHCAPSCLHLGARRGDRYLDPALLLRWRGPRLLPLSGAPPG